MAVSGLSRCRVLLGEPGALALKTAAQPADRTAVAAPPAVPTFADETDADLMVYMSMSREDPGAARRRAGPGGPRIR